MIVETSALTSIGSALWSVYSAYGSIKSNKERCKQLVDRCQMIVDRLHLVLSTDPGTRIINRIGDLETTFKTTADTITKVGQQSYITSLLRMEENAALIEDAQRALTELISTLSLETIIDVSVWQKENDAVYRKEFAQVKKDIHRLEKNFSTELAAHGTTIGQLTDAFERIEMKYGSPATPSDGTTQEVPLIESQPRARSWSSPAAVRPSIASLLDRALPPEPSGETGGNRRTGHMNRSNLGRSSIVAPPLSAGCELRKPCSRPIVSSPLVQSRMCAPLSRSSEEALTDVEIPDDPPPPYTALSWEDEVAAAYERIESSNASGRPADSRTSTQAVRSFDLQEADPASPGFDVLGKPIADDPLVKVRQYLKRKEINNFYAMKTIGQFGKINARVLVELWLFPKNRTFDTAVSLDSFEPLERDKLQLIRSRAHQNKEVTSPGKANTSSETLYNHVLLLCPRQARPTVVIIERSQLLPQQVVRAYIIDAVEPTTLVSVRQYNKRSWLLIPFYPEMSIAKAKEYVQSHFKNALVTECMTASRSSKLHDNMTLLQSGIHAYDYNLSMEILSAA